MTPGETLASGYIWYPFVTYATILLLTTQMPFVVLLLRAAEKAVNGDYDPIICRFCKKEIGKHKMKKHLKSIHKKG